MARHPQTSLFEWCSPSVTSIDDGECERASMEGLLMLAPVGDDWVAIFRVLKLLLDSHTVSSHRSSGANGVCPKEAQRRSPSP